MTGRVVVLGSINVDLVVSGVALPRPGQTVTGGTFAVHHGGKGGNAAVAVARALRGGPLEGAVALVGAVGHDANGDAALRALSDAGVAVAQVAVRDDGPTGVALVVVGPDGENQIAVAPGANAALEPKAVTHDVKELLRDGGVLLTSLEVAPAAVEAAAQAARASGALVILDPAPAAQATAGLLDLADVLTPNELELTALGGVEVVRHGRPRLCLAVTLGAAGVRLVTPEGERSLPALVVEARDATGAGDTFNGALAAGLLEGRDWAEAASRANAAAGLSVTVPGARDGMPLRALIEEAARR